MPTVPTKDNLSAGLNTTTSFRFRPESATDAGIIAGEQLQERGKAVEKLGVTMTKLELERLEQANRLRVEDAMNKAREEAIRLQYDPDEGFDNLKGYDALNRPEGQPLTEEYSGKLKQRMNDLMNELATDDQKDMFYAEGSRLIQGFKENTLQYEGKQFQEYSKSVRRGTIANRTQEIALSYGNPDVVSESIKAIEASSLDLARQEGYAANEAEALARKAVSKGHMVVIETALQNEDSVYADEYFKKYAASMEADDILRVNSVLGEQLDTKIATGVVSGVLASNMTNFVTPDSDRAFNIALNTESAGQHFGGPGSVAGPDEPTTSTAGAIGIAQVMPDTGPEAAKLAGVEWDEERFRNDPAYNRALGKAYFEQQLKTFDGSLAKAYAAYNAGPGATRRAVEEAGPGGDWLSLLPAETQNYVTKNMNAFSAGKGSHDRPTLLEVQNEVRRQIGTDSPRRLKLALAEAEKQYDVVTESIKAEEEKAVANAMRELLANGGDYKSLDPLMRSSIPPDQVGKIIDFASKISKGADTTNLVLYNQFTEAPELLAELTDDQFIALRAEFNESDFKHFSQIRADLMNGNLPEAQNPGSLNTAAIKNAVDNRLDQMGLKQKDDPEQIGAIRKFVDQAVILSQTANGKKMNDSEVEQFIDKLFSQRGVYDGMFDTQGPVLGTAPKYIPAPIKKQLKAAFRKQGIEPTNADLLDAYWRHVFFNEARAADRGSF